MLTNGFLQNVKHIYDKLELMEFKLKITNTTPKFDDISICLRCIYDSARYLRIALNGRIRLTEHAKKMHQSQKCSVTYLYDLNYLQRDYSLIRKAKQFIDCYIFLCKFTLSIELFYLRHTALGCIFF